MLTLEENIFDLLGNGSSLYHSAIVTSFTFDPYYFTNYYMPQMRTRGIKNVVVLIDSTQYDAIMEDAEISKEFRHDFALIRVQNKSNGVFHPKASLFIGERQALALIGSGNLTYSGLSHNKELWGAFCADNKYAKEAAIIKDTWSYLSNIIKSSNSDVAIQQLEWCKTYSAAIRDFESVEYSQEHDFKFLYAKPEESIFNQVKNFVTGDVDTIKLIAPFYDSEGCLINYLKDTFSPKTIKCAIDDSFGYIPYKIKETSTIQFFHWHEIYKKEDPLEIAKKLHAKAIQFETSNGNFLVLGSANATDTAYGLNAHKYNDEANIIFRSQKIDFFKKIGIDFSQPCAKDIKSFRSDAKYNIRSSNKKFLTHITLCERHLHNKLYITIDKIIPGIKIRLYLDKEYRDYDFNTNGIETSGLERIQYAVVILGKNEISNKALVLDFVDLARRNPDSKYSKIESLFHINNGDWDNNIAKILSYVNFDIKDKRHTISDSKKSSDTSSDKNEIVISKEQFDNTRFSKSIDTNLYSLNMHILDQIQFFNSNKQENNQEIDEAENIEDLVTGNTQNNNQERRNFKSYSNKNEILSYLKRLKRHYDNIAKDFDEDSFYKLQSRGFRFNNNVTCNNYSVILIAIMLIFQRIAHPIKGDYNDLQYKRYFAELIGRFMMIYRAGYPNTKDFTYTKLEEMHRNFVVYSLLILSTTNMNKDRIKVWTLNLLDTYKEDMNKINNCFNDYVQLANEYKGLLKEYATEAINQALNTYQNFLRTKDNIKTISEYSEKFYFYRHDFGFMFCKQIKKIDNYYRLEVVYPGAKDLETTFTNNLSTAKIVE